MRDVRVAIAGFGGVGQAIATSLLARQERYAAVQNASVRLIAVCSSKAGIACEGGLSADQLNSLDAGRTGIDFLLQTKPDIVIEAGPTDYQTGEPGLGYIRAALMAGCDAIVVSKGALVREGRALRQLARTSGSMLEVSGASGAGLPAIDMLRAGLTEEIVRLEGILNVTTTYLLDAMMQCGITLQEAMIEARMQGFVERDPQNDIEGWDAAAKLLLIANFGLDADLSIDDVTVTGIANVTEAQVAGWRAQATVPRLVATLTRERGEIHAEVGLRTYLTGDPMALVRGKTKAIRITTREAGETMVSGGGEEPGTTAAAALKDLELILRARLAGPLWRNG